MITSAPGDSQTSFYRVRLYWKGTDPDGEVTGYEWAVTESLPDPESIEYSRTVRTDSTFNLQVEPNREVLGHRFYVRAIDNEGKRDPSPAYTFFAVRNNCVPRAVFNSTYAFGPNNEIREITSVHPRAPTDTIPAGWGVAFSWHGEDCDVALELNGEVDTVGHVVSYSHHLSPLEINDIAGSIEDTVAVYEPRRLRSDIYSMYVRAIDDAGFAGLDPSLRTFVWNYDPKTYFKRAATVDRPDSFSVYFADTTDDQTDDFVQTADGDTLPIRAGGLRISAEVRGYDPDSPDGNGGVSALQARFLRDTALWETLGESRRIERDRIYSGDYYLMCRSQDAYGRFDGTPDTIRVHANRGVRWKYRANFDDGSSFVQRPFPNEVIHRPAPADTLILKFLAVDPDPLVAQGEPGLEWRYRFLSYPSTNGQTGDGFFSGWSIQTAVYWAPRAQFTTPSLFLPGEYTLMIEVRDYHPNSDVQVETRTSKQIVHFTIAP